MDNAKSAMAGSQVQVVKTQQIKNAIANNQEDLRAIKERLYKIQENLFGPMPLQNGIALADKPASNGIIDDILRELSYQDDIIKTISEIICGLERL